MFEQSAATIHTIPTRHAEARAPATTEPLARSLCVGCLITQKRLLPDVHFRTSHASQPQLDWRGAMPTIKNRRYVVLLRSAWFGAVPCSINTPT